MKIKIDGRIDAIDVDFEHNLVIMKYDPIASTALTMENPCIVDGTAKLSYRSYMDLVALTDTERKQVVEFIKKLLTQRASLQDSLNIHNRIARIHGEDIV